MQRQHPHQSILHIGGLVQFPQKTEAKFVEKMEKDKASAWLSCQLGKVAVALLQFFQFAKMLIGLARFHCVEAAWS